MLIEDLAIGLEVNRRFLENIGAWMFGVPIQGEHANTLRTFCMLHRPRGSAWPRRKDF